MSLYHPASFRPHPVAQREWCPSRCGWRAFIEFHNTVLRIEAVFDTEDAALAAAHQFIRAIRRTFTEPPESPAESRRGFPQGYHRRRARKGRQRVS